MRISDWSSDVCSSDLRLTRELWTPKVTLRRDWRSMLGALMPRLFGFDGHLGMVHDGPLLEALEPPFGGKTFEQTKIPLHIVATDLANGEKVVVNSGSVRDAVDRKSTRLNSSH